MIRVASPADAAATATIYTPHVLTGTASFETEAPDTAEMMARLARVQDRGWPWLVWEAEGALLGYACASQFCDRSAYSATWENSIYVAAAAA
jgi:phosphinothricin acetyltransferase